MSASTATTDTLMRQARPRVVGGQAGRLAIRDLHMLFQVCVDSSRLRVPVSPGVSAVSSRTVMNNAG
ncbi:MAG: hypothetical protein U0236_22285 [Nitrospira sp.]